VEVVKRYAEGALKGVMLTICTLGNMSGGNSCGGNTL
jgi:hypothetical protein